MKKLFSIIMLAVLLTAPVSCKSPANKSKVDAGATEKLVNNYTGKDGFEVMSFGGMAMGLMKMLANATAGSAEDKEALNVLSGITRFESVINYRRSIRCKSIHRWCSRKNTQFFILCRRSKSANII